MAAIGAITSGQTIAFDSTERFGKVKANYSEYAIKGVKVEWMPYFTTAVVGLAQQTNAINNMFLVQDLDNFNLPTTPDPELVSKPGFRNMNPYRPWKRYFSCKKLSKQQNVPWISTTAPLNSDTELIKSLAMVRFNLAAPPTGTLPLGNFKVTWFVTFRG